MEKYSLNEGNESLKRILLMMDYDSKKTLEENHKNIFEQDSTANAIDVDNALDPDIVAKDEKSTGDNASSETETTTTPLSYKDAVTKLQNLLITKYQAKLGTSGPNKDGVDGKIGPLTLAALNNVIKTKVSQPVNEPSGEVKVDDKKTEIITPNNQITPESNVSVVPGSIDDLA
jgi:hypothetical protein